MINKSNPPDEPARARVQLNARIPPELDKRMRDFQHERGMRRQQLIETALQEYLNRHERRSP